MATISPTSILSLETFDLLNISNISSKRWLILTDIVNNLRNITPINGYTNKINYVSNDPIDYDEIDDAQIPFIIVDDIENAIEIITPFTNIHLDSELEIIIKVIWRSTTDLSKNLDTIIKDVKTALYNDITRGGQALFSEITNVEIEKTEKLNTVIINFSTTIEYTHTLTNV